MENELENISKDVLSKLKELSNRLSEFIRGKSEKEPNSPNP